MYADLLSRRLPHQVREGTGTFNPAADRIKVKTLHVSKAWSSPWWHWWAWATCRPKGKTSGTRRGCFMGRDAGDVAVDSWGCGVVRTAACCLIAEDVRWICARQCLLRTWCRLLKLSLSMSVDGQSGHKLGRGHLMWLS